MQKEQTGSDADFVRRYYFAGWQALHEMDWASSTETMVHRWVYGPWIDESLECTDIVANPDTFYYLHEDHLGSIRVIADDQGVIKESYRYSEWGETATYDANFAAISDPEVSAIGNRWAFTGRQLEEDVAEGAYFYRARHYDTSLGRFLQRDNSPGGEPRYNRYSYGLNAPLSYQDPMGLDVAVFVERVVIDSNTIGPPPPLPGGWPYGMPPIVPGHDFAATICHVEYVTSVPFIGAYARVVCVTVIPPFPPRGGPARGGAAGMTIDYVYDHETAHVDRFGACVSQCVEEMEPEYVDTMCTAYSNQEIDDHGPLHAGGVMNVPYCDPCK
ncbi:MAG TPA: RHS repeat-associated core domain-containing protein [Planctomycetota bacterium]|nr:RHS repeat-associated core domain-containing protein [Planctomycetota bacterium]